MTWILLAAALFFSAVLAYIPTTFETSYIVDNSGNQTVVTGVKAIHELKSKRKELGISGIITPQKLKEAVETWQFYLEKYNAEDTYELPNAEGIFYKHLQVYSPLIPKIKEAYMNSDTGMASTIRGIDPEKLDSFYPQCSTRLSDLMKLEQKNHPSAQKQAEKMYHKIAMPFTYYSGIGSEAIEYQTILIFLVTILLAVIAAPVFSSDYQTQADDILRCTKHGRLRLGITKVMSALCICSVSFLLCVAVWAIITNTLFGWDSTKTSIQLIFSISTLMDLNVGELELFNTVASLISLLALLSFILFFSSRMKNTVASMALTMLFCLLPMIVYIGAPGAVGDWLRCLLPGGGIGLNNSLLYAVTDLEFLHLGSFSIWNTYVLIGASLVEIPLFLILAVFSYCRKSA